ncbi:helix-turn-helix domain-containing protein [Herbaspirillum rhizosphaerae]|uniref:helix-turn-helix domain-containing protein n=1 Tax=Herbaspirillum rhizosphaerae TaxID=346179 RepID=UPI00067DDBF8|nr:helix-turn-helix domain-containing protein [Herbaspirillum rhizosphaerae]
MSRGYSAAVSRLIANQEQRYAFPAPDAGLQASMPHVIHQHFTVAGESRSLQAPAWGDYVGRILDFPVSRTQREFGFRGEIDTYVLSDMIYLDSRTDALSQSRTNARISRDSVRDYVFHVAVEGIMETATGTVKERKSAQFVPGILALDMGQSMHMVRPTWSRVLAFFLPRAMVEEEIPDAESLHGQVVGYTTPLTRLVLDRVTSLCHGLPTMQQEEAEQSIRVCAGLILAAFKKQSRRSAGAHAAIQTATRNQIRDFIEINLRDGELTTETILRAFPIPRPTLYRMFEHEGGIGTYIRNRRLREAAAELVTASHVSIMEIAYGWSFGSPSDFTRAFRRAYGVAPQDFRALGVDLLRN